MKQENIFQILPDELLLMIPVKRSMNEVLEERIKLAKWFNPDADKVLTGSCTLSFASISFKGKKASTQEVEDLPIAVKLQDMIDVYNDVTAEQVIAAYKRDSV